LKEVKRFLREIMRGKRESNGCPGPQQEKSPKTAEAVKTGIMNYTQKV
jgi:hypothetical protein